jgi:nitrite reductase/ring-hydroxylating ferredoxin subunit/(2Fe-2S) ferredoxin
MGQYDRHVFVCTSGETCPTQGDTETYVKILRDGARKAGTDAVVRINKSGCFSQCGHGPMIVVYPDDVWYAGVKESDLAEILASHIIGGRPVERLRYDPGVPGANKIEVHTTAVPADAAPGRPRWRRACRADEIPANGMKQFTIDGTDVLLVDAGDAVFAYQAMCPHEAVALETGVHDGCVLTCLEHMWQFDVRSGAPMGDALAGLTGYPVKREGDEIYVEVRGTSVAGSV